MVEYPIRSQKYRRNVAGIKNNNSKFTEQDLKEIYILLQNRQDLTMKKIAQQYKVYASTIQKINLGQTYYNENFTYPLRKPKTGSRKLSQEQIIEIIKEIKNNPKESLSSIGKRLNVHRKTISSINCGTIYKQKNEKYPIR